MAKGKTIRIYDSEGNLTVIKDVNLISFDRNNIRIQLFSNEQGAKIYSKRKIFGMDSGIEPNDYMKIEI